MSNLYVENIDEFNNTVTTLLALPFSALPLFLPWVRPQPVRRVRISMSGDSTSFYEGIISYWRPEKSGVNVSTYTQPSYIFSGGGATSFAAWCDSWYGPWFSMYFGCSTPPSGWPNTWYGWPDDFLF